MRYSDFIKSKKIIVDSVGMETAGSDIHSLLFDFQNDLTRWAIRKGRCALFLDTGLGKTYCQLEWARLLGKRTLIIAPLSVARQTVKMARDVDLEIHYTRSGNDLIDGINITNYEMIDHFDADDFGAVVADESSVLKNVGGKTRRKLTEMFFYTPYKLCCTATPAPNDIAEIANHAEFLGIMTRTDMMAAFFVHDQNGWRLKRHAQEPFYRWLASWGMSVKKPSDLGYDDSRFILPELSIEPVFVKTSYKPGDRLFFTGLKGITDRSKVRRGTLAERVERATQIANESGDQFIVWCGLNDESAAVAKMINDSVEVKGADSIDKKINSIQSFQDGDVRVLVTKAKIAGMGLNLQNCHRQIFVGLNDSWESYYQAIRRSWRFGQDKPVIVHVVLSEIEDAIWKNVQRKEAEAERMSAELIKHVAEFEKAEIEGAPMNGWTYKEKEAKGRDWTLILGDSCERMAEIESESVDLSVFSPPFQALYQYSPTERDLGNSTSPEQFDEHFGYIVDHLLRVTKLGRVCAVHCADIPAMMVRDGYIGMKDFSGDLIRLFIQHGWIFGSRIPIDKNQQAQSIRTHTKALTMTQLEKDRSWLRPAIPDYILKFRKPGENEVPIVAGLSRDTWIEWANPTWPSDDWTDIKNAKFALDCMLKSKLITSQVRDRALVSGAFATWYGISETDTLQGWRAARGDNDNRHICPLQLGTIERCIKLWSNPGELVLSPFAGIGSELYVAIKQGRRAIGIELKENYFKTAIENLKKAETTDLFQFYGMKV